LVDRSHDESNKAIGVSAKKFESIFHGEHDYGVIIEIFGNYICLGWFISECGVR